MPAMDGFEVYNEIKKIDSRVKVCFITATHKVNYKALKLQERETIGQEETSHQYCALDKDMFLQKPISNKDLVNEINKRIRDYR
jgi:CheY-like chemotaxis protein